MKKNILIVIMFIGVSLDSFCQTTQEEYNYVTKGYKVQIESGLDMKEGYELVALDTVTSTSAETMLTIEIKRWASLSVLYRAGEDGKEIAAYMIHYKSNAESVNQRLCVPHPNSDKTIMNLYWGALYYDTYDQANRLRLIAYLLGKNLLFHI